MDSVFPFCGPEVAPRFVLEAVLFDSVVIPSGTIQTPWRRTEKARGGCSRMMARAVRTGSKDA